MFTKPLSQVEYSDIEAFCGTFGEGIRVEYKSEMIKEIPKTISAFANTLGGIIVIGAETDKVQNKVTAINGIDNKAGIEEGIINSSLQGIYPSVIPEVKIFEIPGKAGKILVVVKVHESIEAPHAIQNSTRVYIRTRSTSQPYELAEIDRIEYMLKRRDKLERLKDELIQNARASLERFLPALRPVLPLLYVSVSPVFPYQPLISLDELYVFCNAVPYNSTLYPAIDNPQRITDGICKFYGDATGFHYREINHYGVIYVCETLDKSKSRWRGSDEKKNEMQYVRFAHFIYSTGRVLKLAEMFYGKCGYLGNLEVKMEVKNIANESLMLNDEGFPEYDRYKAIDNGTASSDIIIVEDIDTKLLDIIVSLMRNILWVFNCPVTNSQQIVERVLIANGLIEKGEKFKKNT